MSKNNFPLKYIDFTSTEYEFVVIVRKRLEYEYSKWNCSSYMYCKKLLV